MSKMKQWSREYACISSIKDNSGSGWDSVEKRVMCSQEMWNSHAQGHSGLMRKNYNWPLYDDWEIIFGKDRANGKGAIGVEEAAKRFVPDIINNANKEKGLEEDFGCNEEGWYDGDDGATSKNQTKRTKTATSAPLSTADEGIVAAISQVFNKERCAEDPTNVLRSKLNRTLKELGLSKRDRVKLGRKMIHDDKWLHFFFSLDVEEREDCVRQEIDEIGTYHPVYE